MPPENGGRRILPLLEARGCLQGSQVQEMVRNSAEMKQGKTRLLNPRLSLCQD